MQDMSVAVSQELRQTVLTGDELEVEAWRMKNRCLLVTQTAVGCLIVSHPVSRIFLCSS